MRIVLMAGLLNSLFLGAASALPAVELQQIGTDQPQGEAVRLAQIDRSAPAQTQTQIAEEFIDLVAQGQFDAARQLMNPTLQEGWTVAQMQENWSRLQEVIGSYQRRLNTEVVDEKLVLVNLEFEKATDNLLVIFDEQHQISGVDFPLQLPRL